jgi:hypothetical protein
MLLLGGAIVLAASVGLSLLAGATVRSFEVMTWRIGEPPPGPLGRLDDVAGLAGLFALGWIVACAGISSPGPGSSVTLAGRILYAAAGLMTIAGSLPLIYGILAMRHMFMLLATSEATPKVEELELTMSHCGWYPVLGFDIAVLAAVFVLLAGVAGLRKAAAPQAQGTSSLQSMIMIGITALLAVLFALLFVLVSRHGAALAFMLADSSSIPRASDLAQHLIGIVNKSLYAYVLLLLLGILQIVVAALAPDVARDTPPEATA